MTKKEIFLLAAMIFSCVAPVSQAGASILYKKYLVANYGGVEILCEPYIVRKDDSVIKLLREKGEISANDFPEFFRIFQSINPRISDINLIRQNDEIYIPLKKLTPNSLPGQSTGVVSIPLVSLTSFGEMLEAHTEEHIIKEGDNVSGIIDEYFQPSSPEEEKRGLNLFKKLNPEVTSLDQISSGEKIVVPKASIKTQPWFKSMYETKGSPHPEKKAVQKIEEQPLLKKSPSPLQSAEPPPMEKFASLVGGKIYKTGQYFIPKTDGGVHKIDLSKDPMIDVEGGGKVLFCENYESITDSDKTAIKKAMPDTSIIDADKTDTVEGIIDSMASASVLRKPGAPVILNSDNALIEIMPEWLFVPGRTNSEKKVFLTPLADDSKKSHAFFIDYLKHVKGVLLKEMSGGKKDTKEPQKDYFVDETETVTFSVQSQLYANLSIALGYSYSENAQHSIAMDDGQYTDITADTIYSPDGQIFVLADSELSQDNIKALKESGIRVLEFPEQNSEETDFSESTISHFLEMLGCKTHINPNLKILTTRSGDPYVTIKPAGVHARTPSNTEYIITKGKFASPVTAALQQAGIKTVILSFNSFY